MDNQFDAINESISTNQGPFNIKGFARVHDSRLNSAIGQELRDQVSSAASQMKAHEQQFQNYQVKKMYNNTEIASFGSAETKLKQL